MVDRVAVVVDGRRLEQNAECTDEAGDRENPEQETVDHHRCVFPVVYFLFL